MNMEECKNTRVETAKDYVKNFNPKRLFILLCRIDLMPVTAARSKACSVFSRSEAGIVGSNLTQVMDVWCVYAFILCL
jgi:hypothetical protein